MTEKSYRILVVDDEVEIRRFLRAVLTTHQHQVVEAENGKAALSAIHASRPDLIILDLGLPDFDGHAVTRQVREWSNIPIIILSVRNREAEKIEALNAGADDYLTKPFGVGELLARIQVVMRRVGNTGSQPVYQVKDLVVDCTRRLVQLKGIKVDLTATEFDILNILIQNAGKVVTQQHIIQKVWGAGYADETRLLRVNISNIRKKIEMDPAQPEYILTEIGIGYRLLDE
jgi:two-component system KDP operon response regulator KdpE